MKKIRRKLKELWNSLFGAMKITEEEILKSPNIELNPSMTINQEVHDKRVSTALLAGKETKEVKELRYRTYIIDREAKEYEVFSPTLAMRKEELEKQDSKFVYYDDSDGLNVVTIQNNFPIIETVEEGLKQVGERGKRTEYWINIEREFGFIPRYRIEEYTKKLVIKEKTAGKTVVLDFYVSKYPNQEDLKSKGFVKEIEKIKNDNIRSDILDINIISFETNQAYKLKDMLYFSFKKKQFIGITEYDGHYVIKFLADILVNGQDRVNEFYNKEMAEKYKNKQRKEVIHDLIDDKVDGTTDYKCEECGRTIEYNPQKIVDINPNKYDEENTDPNGLTEFMDLQIAENTFGKKLCKNCLTKYINELEKTIGNEQESDKA